ncbi:hypothetical protein VTH06DRAFT_196 [Thermothelomyces fergusii]
MAAVVGMAHDKVLDVSGETWPSPPQSMAARTVPQAPETRRKTTDPMVTIAAQVPHPRKYGEEHMERESEK